MAKVVGINRLAMEIVGRLNGKGMHTGTPHWVLPDDAHKFSYAFKNSYIDSKLEEWGYKKRRLIMQDGSRKLVFTSKTWNPNTDRARWNNRIHLGHA